jgi:hypothetical protein
LTLFLILEMTLEIGVFFGHNRLKRTFVAVVRF